MTVADAGWGRLNGRLVLVNASVLVPPLALLLPAGRLGLQALITLGSLVLTLHVICGISLMRCATTRFRVSGDRIELRSGLLFRTRRSIPLARVRGVDLTANPLHRIFGLTTLRVDTGEQGAGAGRRLRLDGLATNDAAALRRRIIDGRDAAGADIRADGDDLIAELDWSWLRFAPLTVWGVGSVLVTAGSVVRVLGEMKINPLEFDVVRDLVDRFGSVPLRFGVTAAILLVIVLGVISSTVSYIESWSGYRLRHEGDRILTRRGLLATRAVSIPTARLRGVELIEPIPLRWAGGARLDALAGGLGNVEDNRKRRALTPPAPRAEVLRVAGVLLPDAGLISRAGLIAHPRAALRRRINRGLIIVALLAAVPITLGIWFGTALVHLGLLTAVVLTPIALLFAAAAYRNLGHRIRGRHLVVSSGAFTRRTAALDTGGIIGWNISRSFGQRRLGLLTLGATTAAGESVYRVRDVAAADGLTLAEQAVPGILTPFLEGSSATVGR